MGSAVTLVPVEALNPELGAQEYVLELEPLMIKFSEAPEQIETSEGKTLTILI